MDHYQVLGVPYTATRTEIEDAYRALLSQSNTDKDPTASNTSQEDQDQLQSAYKILSDKVKRSVYDATLTPETSLTPLIPEASSSGLTSGNVDLFSPLTDDRPMHERHEAARAARAAELDRLRALLKDMRSWLEEIEQEEAERLRARKQAKAALRTRDEQATTRSTGVNNNNARSLFNRRTILPNLLTGRSPRAAPTTGNSTPPVPEDADADADEDLDLDLSPEASAERRASYKRLRSDIKSDITMTEKRLALGLKATKELERKERKQREKEEKARRAGEVRG